MVQIHISGALPDRANSRLETWAESTFSSKALPLKGEGWVGVSSVVELSRTPNPHTMNRCGSPLDIRSHAGGMAGLFILSPPGRESNHSAILDRTVAPSGPI